MYKISEIAKLLGVTRMTVYNKVNALQQELKKHVCNKKGIKHIDEAGVQIIRESLAVKKDENNFKNSFTEEEITNDEDVENTTDRQVFDTLQSDYIESLKVHIGVVLAKRKFTTLTQLFTIIY